VAARRLLVVGACALAFGACGTSASLVSESTSGSTTTRRAVPAAPVPSSARTAISSTTTSTTGAALSTTTTLRPAKPGVPAITVTTNDPAVVRAFALGVDKAMIVGYYHSHGFEAPDPLILAAGQPVAVDRRDVSAALRRPHQGLSVNPSTAKSFHVPGTPFSSYSPRSMKSIPDPATRSLTMPETRISPAPASPATRAAM
jgi:hypothetical protein